MKKTPSIVLALLLAASLLSFASAASPSINVDNIATPDVELDVSVEPDPDELQVSLGDIRDAIENADSTPAGLETADGGSVDNGLAIRLKRLKVNDEAVARMRDIALFIEQLPVAVNTGDEAEERVYLMDEIYNLKVEGYEAAQGDISANFRFVTEYQDDAILMVMIGAAPAAAGEDEMETAWFCLRARAEDGQVYTTMPAEVLEAAAADESALFALLRVDVPVEEELS